jgi:hypothetical protein
MAEETNKPSVFASAGAFFGRVLLPLGLFSVLVVGLHVGSDRLDDHLFELFSFLDNLFDSASSFLLRTVLDALGVDPKTTALWIYRAIEWIDVDQKAELARVGALVVELTADFVLALPVFFHKYEGLKLLELREQARRIFLDPTLLKFALPVAIFAAGLGGAFSVSREIQVWTHSRIAHSGIDADVANFIASSTGFIALALVLWRVLFPLMLGAIEYADRRARNDLATAIPLRKRRLRGLSTAFLALPVALIAFFATPIAGTVRALLWL